MTNWFAAHLIMYVELKDGEARNIPVLENIVLIKANSEDEAFEKAERRGRGDEGDDGGSFRWDAKPARWRFAGVRKLTLCQQPEERPDDGIEISYTEMRVSSLDALYKLASGKPVGVRYHDMFSE